MQKRGIAGGLACSGVVAMVLRLEQSDLDAELIAAGVAWIYRVEKYFRRPNGYVHPAVIKMINVD